jgi:hypothetical protein
MLFVFLDLLSCILIDFSCGQPVFAQQFQKMFISVKQTAYLKNVVLVIDDFLLFGRAFFYGLWRWNFAFLLLLLLFL